MTRGIRLNNPGNIRISSITWLGKISPSEDPEFETFDTAEHGIRAIARILLTYFQRDGLDTVAALIGKWAPPSENETGSYIDDVAFRAGFGPSEQLEPSADVLSDLTGAIIFHENGSCPYTDETIASAVASVLPDVPPNISLSNN